MSYPVDLTEFFCDWPYDEKENIRFFVTEDKREVMQIRQPLGVEQYELDGRPDGVHFSDGETALDVCLERSEKSESSGEQFILKDSDFYRLRDEGILYYFRYLALFQVGRYDRVVRDTEHNLAICNLLERNYPYEKRFEMLQYLPYIRRINAISKAMLALADSQPEQALEELKAAYEEIENHEPVESPIYEFEKIRSLQHLKQVISQVKNGEGKPQTHQGLKEQLQGELNGAVEEEDYERAARLRDRLRRLM